MNQKIFNEAKKASEKLKNSNSWTIFTHRKADGDAIGSACSLFEMGIQNGKNVKWFGPDKAPLAYNFLDRLKDYKVFGEDIFKFNKPDELYVFLDCASENRSVRGFDVNLKINSLNIDHHEDNSMYGIINFVDGSASSTCEMLFRLFKSDSEQWKISKKIAESLYTGIFTDTGGFSFKSTSSETHEIAAELIEIGVDPGHMTDFIIQNKTSEGLALWSKALSKIKIFGPENNFAVSWLSIQDFKDSHASVSDTEGLPNMLMTLKGVKMAILLTETFNGSIRGSFRSREGLNFCAADIARNFGGGGHERAAGATLEGPIEKAIEEIDSLIFGKFYNHDGIDIDK